jgi:ribulose-phosphate 3-epimerase
MKNHAARQSGSKAATVAIEIVPAILRTTYEKIAEDWEAVRGEATHVQIDVTDGIFAGDGTFLEVRRFKQLAESEKCELHMMVHTPAHFVDDVINLAPARCIFHLESFAGTGDIEMVYEKLRQATQTQLALAISPKSPTERLDEYLGLLDYVLFMGYHPGWAGQPLNQSVFRKIGAFRDKHPDVVVAVDGHVDKKTVGSYVQAGASILCANTAVFGSGNARENIRQLTLLAEAAQRE